MENLFNFEQKLNNDNTSQKTFGDIIVIIFNFLFDVGFIILPSIGYIHQYYKIMTLKKTEGFSKFISFVLITSFIIRIFFWIGKRFEITILINAIFGILIQLLLLRICLKYDLTIKKNEKNIFKRLFNLKEFWNWPYFIDYLIFLIFISSLIGIISLIIGYDNEPYVFALGVLTSLIESFLDVPQIYELYKSKDPFTISYLLVFGWICGDMFKVGYFFLRDTPIQLIACAIFQLTTDIILIVQILYYRIKKKRFEKNNENKSDPNKMDINSKINDNSEMFEQFNSDSSTVISS